MSTGGSSDQADQDRKSRRELLLKVYGSALDEYRFNVQLTWDRTKFYIGLASTATAAGVGLMKLASETGWVSSFLIFYFLLVILLSALGWRTAVTGKSYYRQAILTKTLVERELGLFQQLPDFGQQAYHLGLAVTPGQRDLNKTLFRHEEKLTTAAVRGSAVDLVRWVFLALAGVALIGMLLSIVLTLNHMAGGVQQPSTTRQSGKP